ncbi:MAG: endonuclease I family protein [Elusimicrobiales bacterium]
MNRFIAIFTLIALNAASLFAAQPAIDVLRDSAAGFSFEDSLPAAQPPMLYRVFELPEDDINGEELFTYLHEATDPAMRKAAPSYTASKAFMYSHADNTGCNGGPGIITFYSQVCVNGSSDSGGDYPERGDLNGDGVVDSFINAEHIWPQGYFDSKLPMVADLHHLAPTFVTPNSRRSNLKFAKVSAVIYKTSAGSKLGSEGFEPADAVKGNVARAVLYFVVRYHDRSIRQGMDYNSFWVRTVPLLLTWNRQDPPDAAERRRNDQVEDFQGNRNPFIDYPELADRVGELVFKAH